MEGTAYYDVAELLREAALQEAASRAKSRSPLNADTASSSTSLVPRISAEAEGEAEELHAVYEDEKAKNDALARSLDQRLEKLARSNAKTDSGDEQKRLELEWQQIEFAIRALEKEKQHAPPLEAAAVLDVRTRAELHNLNLQYASALDALKSELSAERDALQRENQLHADLEIVQAGLTKRFEQLQRKRRQDLTSESAVR